MDEFHPIAYTREASEIDRDNEARRRDQFFLSLLREREYGMDPYVLREREYGMDPYPYAHFGPKREIPPLYSSAYSINSAIAESELP